MSVIVITGIMAAGKSTVAQLLAESLPRSVHVRGDIFRRMIVSGRREMRPDDEEAYAQLLLRYRLAATTAQAYADHGFTAVVQDVILGPELAGFLGLFTHRPLYCVVLAPSPDVVRSREENRPKTGYGVWTAQELDDALRGDTPPVGLWLDTSHETPQQTVETILADLDAAAIA